MRLAWRVRSFTLGQRAVGSWEAVVIAAFTFVVGTGSVLVFLGSNLVVFHEAEIWGVAWAIGALELVIAFTVTLRPRLLVLASLVTLLALFSRAATGAGPLAALGLLLLVALIGRGHRIFGIDDGPALRRMALPLAIAVLVPVGLYVALNLVKFGTPLSLPFDHQLITAFNATHRAVLQRNHGTLVGSQFVPTSVLQYFRPDAIHFTASFPWVTFPNPATIVGGARFDQVMPASSVPASMPLLSVAGLLGLAGIVTAPRHAPKLAALRAPALGAAAACVVTVAFGFIANRYLADFVPLLVLSALAGIYLLISWTVSRPHGAAVRLAWVAVAGLAVLSVWFSTGLTIAWQRGWDPQVLTTSSVSSSFPPPGDLGNVLIVGDCAALYRSSGSEWRALELTPKAGRAHLLATFPTDRTSGREPLMVSGERGNGQYVFVEYRPGNRVVFGTILQGADVVHRGRPVGVVAGARYALDVEIDPQVPQVSVLLNGARVLEYLATSSDVIEPVRHVTIGRNDIGGPVAAEFTGRLEERPIATPDCRRYQRGLTARSAPSAGVG